MTNIRVKYLCSSRLAWMFAHMLICWLRVRLEIVNANLIQINLDHKLKLHKKIPIERCRSSQKELYDRACLCKSWYGQPSVFLPWFSVISLLIGIFFLCFPLRVWHICVFTVCMFSCSCYSSSSALFSKNSHGSCRWATETTAFLSCH